MSHNECKADDQVDAMQIVHTPQ